MSISGDAIGAALRAGGGNVAYAARQLGVSRQALYKRINRSQQLQALLADERETLVDLAESEVRRQVLHGSLAAAQFVLKASPEARRRGWGDRRLVGGDEASEPIQIKVAPYIDYRIGIAALQPEEDDP